METIKGPIEPRGAGRTLGRRGLRRVPLRARIPTRAGTSTSDSITCISPRYDASTSDPNSGAPVSHYPPSLKGCSNTKEKVLHFRGHISSSMLAVPASDLGLTLWICDPEFLPPFHIRFVCVSLVGYYIGHPSLWRNTQRVRYSSPRPRIISTCKRPSRSLPTDLHSQFPYSARHHHISMPRFRMPPQNRLAAVVKPGKCTHLKDNPLHSNCLLSILSRAFLNCQT